MAKSFDVIVVGSGPAGSLAAIRLARAGMNVAVLERGRYPGAKNMFGGLLHRTPVLEELLSDFYQRAPLERHVYKKVIAFMTAESVVALTFENKNFDHPPFNGHTVYRPVFDRWLAEQAVKEGATLLCDCTAQDVIREDGQIAGVKVKGREGELRARIVIAADGVLSFTARQAGLRGNLKAENCGLGIKLLLGLPEATINERFQLVRDQGADFTFVGMTAGMPGGAFLYTNRESLAIGIVVHLDALRASGKEPYDILQDFLQHSQLRQLTRGAEPLEYSAHLIPEGGFRAIPRLFTDGLLLAGDAAGLCYTTGFSLEGINLAMTSGVLAAETAIEAIKKNDYSARTLSNYRKRLENSFVLKNMKAFRNTPAMMRLERLHRVYPRLLASIMEGIYRTDGTPRPGLLRLVRREVLKNIGLKGVVADGIKIGRSLL